MKCIGCVWGTRINEKVIFCMAPGEDCWKDNESIVKSNKTNKKIKKK